MSKKTQPQRSVEQRKKAVALAAVRAVSKTKFDALDPSSRITSRDPNKSEVRRARWEGREFAFPRTLRGIRRAPPYIFSNDLGIELQQLVMATEHFADDLNAFNALKNQFESSLLSTSIDAAQVKLNEIKERFGQSIWSVEAAFLLASYTGLENIRSQRMELFNEDDRNGINFFVYWFARRAEPATTAASYDQAVNEIAETSRSDGVELQAYTTARINLHRAVNFSHLSYFLWRESQLPIIDQYNSLIRVVQLIAGLGESHKGWPLLSGTIQRLSRSIKSPVLMHLLAIVDPPSAEFEELHLPYIPLMDAYTQGRYELCISECARQLIPDGGNLALYELHAKATILAGSTYNNPFRTETPGFQIYANMYDVLSKTNSATQSIQFLLKTSYVYDATSIGLQLFSFSTASLGQSCAASTAGLLSASCIGPRTSDAISSHLRKMQFLNKLHFLYPESISVRLFMSLASVATADIEGLPLDRATKYKARRFEKTCQYPAALIEYCTLQALAGARSIYQEDAATGLYRCLMAAGATSDAVRHASEIYLRNKMLLMSVRLSELMEPLQENDAIRPIEEIDWPIISYVYYREVKLVEDSSYRIYVALDDFLSSLNILKPSDMISTARVFDHDKLVFFLRYVCVPEIMRHSVLAFDSAASVATERITICQWLLTLQTSVAEELQQEIVNLTTQSMIRRAVRDVGERKVHVDIPAILEFGRTTLSDTYGRYVANLAITDERLRKSFPNISPNPRQRIVLMHAEDEAFQVFKEMFNAIRSQFLYSTKHGLNFFLSVRIRHGTVANQIRRQFQTAHLVTVKDSGGKYSRNDHWWDIFSHDSIEASAEVDSILQEFSEAADVLIEKVRGVWIQIKNKSNESGLFDFEFSQQQLMLLHLTFQVMDDPDMEKLVHFILEQLSARTKTELAKIREYISGELKDSFVALLNNLERSFAGLSIDSNAWRFFGALASCRTGIQNELDTIAGWFNIVDQEDIPDFDLSLAVNTGIEITKSLNPTFELSPVLKIDPGIRCHGTSFLHFVDIIQILLENVVRHTRAQSATVDIEARAQSGVLTIEVRNELPKGFDRAVVLQRRDAFRNETLPSEAALAGVVAREGGTGFLKIRKLLEGSLHSSQVQVDFDIQGEDKFVAHISLELKEVQV